MILQNVIFQSEYCSCRDMFWRETEEGISFDTYFNLFSYARWKEYTDFRTLSFSVLTEGNGKVRFFDEERNLLLETQITGGQKASVTIPDGLKCAVLFFIWIPEKRGEGILDASFETEDLPKHDVKLAVDICTYKREAFVTGNAGILSGLEGVYTYIADNGNTLDAGALNSEKVKVYPNLNSGGSGGFTRGMLEILKEKGSKNLTHVVLMDDDVRFMPEAFLRLKSLLSLRTEKYQDACVSGNFLNSEVGYMQSEGGSLWPDLRTYAKISNVNLDLRSFDNCVKNEEEYVSDHAAWWFACYPLSVVREDNLPLPFFIRLDDSEYGIRAGVPVLRINGINVWHEPSENKKDSSLYYYAVRNMLILNAVHGTKNSKKKMYQFCVRSMCSNLLRYRYQDMDIVVKAVEDFLKGPEFFETADPSEYHQMIRKMGYQLKDVRELTDEREALKEIETFSREKDLQSGSKHSVKNLLTLNGWLLPAKWDRVYAFPLSVSQEKLYRIGEAVFFDSSNGKGILGEKEYKGLFHFMGNCIRLAGMFGGYGKAYKKFYEAGKYLTGAGFWRKYLKLENRES